MPPLNANRSAYCGNLGPLPLGYGVSEGLPQRQEQIEREIDGADRQMDQWVYPLHGLTEEEIAMAQEATK